MIVILSGIFLPDVKGQSFSGSVISVTTLDVGDNWEDTETTYGWYTNQYGQTDRAACYRIYIPFRYKLNISHCGGSDDMLQSTFIYLMKEGINYSIGDQVAGNQG